jgi:RNA polymerase sigma factor (sigma-70 family)
VAAGDTRDASVLPGTVTNVDFPECFAAERKPLVRFVRSLGADPELAADIAQTAFERAFGMWDTIEHPRSWLRRVAQRELAEVARKARREKLTDSPPERSGAVSAAMAVELRAQSRDVLAVLAALPDKQRQVMAWSYDGFSAGEIARELGDSPEAVRQSRAKARKKLRRAFEPIKEGGAT